MTGKMSKKYLKLTVKKPKDGSLTFKKKDL